MFRGSGVKVSRLWSPDGYWARWLREEVAAVVKEGVNVAPGVLTFGRWGGTFIYIVFLNWKMTVAFREQ